MNMHSNIITFVNYRVITIANSFFIGQIWKQIPVDTIIPLEMIVLLNCKRNFNVNFFDAYSEIQPDSEKLSLPRFAREC